MSAKVFPLKGEQALAVDPQDSVWLSASAGTGKTQVLSARVLRLLLREDVRPEHILCLTFTKAGAAEMAERVNAVLASWVRTKPEALAGDLLAIGADARPETQARARTLFASVLDCPGGGLRIDTIHAFSQWLLGAFPEEAGLIPGTQAMEDRDRELLAHRVLADLLVDWQNRGEKDLLGALEKLSLRLGPDGARTWLMRCANAREAWIGPGAWQEPLGGRIRQLLGLESDAGPESLAALCGDDQFDVRSLRACSEANAAWGTKTGLAAADVIASWLAASPARRAETADDLFKALFTQKGEPRSLKALEKKDPIFPRNVDAVRVSLSAVLDHRALLAVADFATPALTVGRRFALAWDDAKQREGLVDFDDLIRRAAALLADGGLGPWIRYKLDRQIDHILVDEAQDTNEAQWSIIRALTDDFFAGEGQRDGKLRTIFVVGDYKQAIFRFQGTSPENFQRARERFRKAMADRAAAARQLRENLDARELVELGLGRSYRTAQSVLQFVDRSIEAIGYREFGLDNAPDPHIGDDRPGLVTLWKPVNPMPDDDDDEDAPDNWLPAPERRMADRIAAQIKSMIGSFTLVKGGKRAAGPGDIMVLVRKRRELAGLIVARLHAAGVPVAGVDRLRLGAPLPVKDLMAALRFAAQPLDDLSLASVLVSPLFGWSQEQLLEHGYRAKGVPLWAHLQRSTDPDVRQSVDMLLDLLARADFELPQALLHWMLVGPWQGRRKLVARLGREANDPIDELLNAALSYAGAHIPSLQGFIQWFDAGEGELKRDPGAGEGLVRVMTVHGSKGLQAPIVILADATGNPDSSPVREISLPDGERSIPLPGLRKAEKVGRVSEAEEAERKAERQEHWRLLYVAMTRAEEALFVGGALGQRDKGEPAPDSWYARLAPLMPQEVIEDPIWGERREFGERAEGGTIAAQAELPIPPSLPQWAVRPIGPEPRPPRPLAPSSAGEDQGSDPPLPPEVSELAARRGVLIHRLLERLPDVPGPQREERARNWLERNAGDMPLADREEMLARSLGVLDEPQWADLFGPDALAEVPLAATVGGQVIAGTADRLLIEPERIMVADFKTSRRPPHALEEVPVPTIRQMAAYAAALGTIYPGRRIEAALLYTQTPQLIVIPQDMLAAHKPGLAAKQESLGG
ncbi:ATP-dependent helicase/nuclease subunit A [Altererythrobacter atlanticus]|uniref:DNA 3'-5' helicase n=1 Tax=Croceibacterium atlanticum TaxID=1267766 RepID=A0A0F7KQD2_9SPHN|nr:double-strand break repair helicase AddA [Croceibacterium atlanticum]AKH41759.1 ATP-dependent helicase/nuclease subunit A [Croceibacterium atlanticum]MBB5733224.1 ATP-dependent helicase/nuclease subunit A [Croceibacterium atlanticum]